MSILIKGIEIPKTATSIEIVFRNGEKVLNSKRLFCDTSVAKLPTPHGRLIDADRLIEELNRNKIPYNSNINYFLMNAPTIIEAEEGET